MKVGNLLGDQDALFEKQTVYRKGKILGAEIKRKIRRGCVNRDELNFMINQPLCSFERKIWMPVPLSCIPACTPTGINSYDIAVFYCRCRRSKVIDAYFFIHRLVESNDDAFPHHAFERDFVHARPVRVKVSRCVNMSPHMHYRFHMGNIQRLLRHLRKYEKRGGGNMAERGTEVENG